MMYENKREEFDELARQYKEYIELYKMLNNGSAVGATRFDEFYWRMTYYSNYSDQETANYHSI